MARYSSADIGFLLLDGYDILGQVTDLDEDQEAILEETTVLGDADETHGFVGLKKGTLSQNGFYDDAADSVNDALIGLAERVMVIGIEGNTIGKQFIGWQGAIAAKYRRQVSGGAFHKATADYQVTGKVEDGLVLHAHAQETAASGDTESSPVDNSALSAIGGAGYLEVSELALGGYTDVTVKIRDSADDIAYGDLITFTNVSSAQTGKRKAVAGTVERYLAMSWAFNGAGAAQSITPMVGFARN